MTGGNPDVADADLLLPFADAALSGDETRLAPIRARITNRLGHAAMLDAAAVIGGFNGITRLADATGIPLEQAKADETAAWRTSLGIDRFQTTKS